MTVFIQKGNAPLSVRQATKRGMAHVAAELAQAGARKGDEELLRVIPHADLPPRLAAVVQALRHVSYQAYALEWEADNLVNGDHNLFNHQLAAYRAAQARLASVRLSVGAAAVYKDRDTGEFDEQGQPITESVLVSPEVPPLVAEDVEYPVLDDEGNQTGTVTEPDRGITARITQDEAERAQAQAVIDATPQEVIDYDAA